MPLIVQSTKHHLPSFNLAIIKNHMQTATKNTTTLENTKVAIVNMYQNGTTEKLSLKAQNAAHALANYIHANKTSKKFAFTLGKDHQDQQLLLLTIANHPATPQVNAPLQRAINQVSNNIQKQDDLSLANQLSWVTKALHKVEFGVLFWIYQNQLSSQEALAGTTLVPPSIIAVNFQRVKTPHEQLQDEAWAKIIQVVHKLTFSQLGISANVQQSPSQTKITTRDVVLALQKIITNNDAISKAAQKLIKADNIAVQLDDKYGKIQIIIKNYGKNKIIVIFGFKATDTPLAIAHAKIDAAKDGVNLPTRFSQVFHDQTPVALDVNAPTKDGVTFKFKLATTVNDGGASTLTYAVDADPQVDGATPQDVTFVVSGFETKAQAAERITAQAKIDAAKDGVNSPTRLNQVFHDQTPVALDVNVPTKDGVTFKFKLATTVNDRGASTLTYAVDADPQVDGATPQDVTFVVSGFETKAQAAERITAQAKIDAAKDGVNSPTRLNQVFHDQTPVALDVNAPTKDGVTFKFKLATTINDGGASTLTYAVDADPQVDGATPQDVTFVVSGFETKGQKDAREVIKKRLDTTMQNIHDGALVIPNGITSSQFDEYVQAMGDVFNESGWIIMSKFAEKYRAHITSLTIPHSFTTIGTWFQDFNKITSLTLGNQLQTIGEYAFSSALLTSLRIPNAVTTIGKYAFASSPLTSLTLGNQLQTIGENAFYYALLTLLRIPNAVTTIGGYAFASSPLTSLTLGNQLQTIGGVAFQHAKLKMLIIPNAVTTIGGYAFTSSPLTSLTLGNQLQTIGNYAFSSALLTLLRIPNAVTTIGGYAFASSPLTSLTLGNQLQTIGEYAFSSALLTSLRIPNAVTRIGNYAFDISPLTSIDIFRDVNLARDVFKRGVILNRPIRKP